MPCLILKQGYSHLTSGINCQDSGCVTDKIKFVADGCGESTNSEVGAQLAALYMSTVKEPTITSLYAYMHRQFISDAALNTIKNYFLFTTLLVEETDTTFEVSYIGDGFIIMIDHYDKITYTNLEESGPPPFGAYNFIDPKRLAYHYEGVEIKRISLSKQDFKNVGVATDGLRFLGKLDRPLMDEFETLLLRATEDNPLRLKLFINKHHSIFQDDITIAL